MAAPRQGEGGVVIRLNVRRRRRGVAKRDLWIAVLAAAALGALLLRLARPIDAHAQGAAAQSPATVAE
jgi:hypothetical protein